MIAKYHYKPTGTCTRTESTCGIYIQIFLQHFKAIQEDTMNKYNPGVINKAPSHLLAASLQ